MERIMTEEKRKEDILKQYKELPKVVVKYIDFLITKINKLVSENTRLAKHILELQKDKGRLTDENKTLKESKQIQTIVAYSQAKEILKMIVDYYPCYNKTITEQAEQFLKEIEK